MHKSRSNITLDMNIEKKEFMKDSIKDKIKMSKLDILEDVDEDTKMQKKLNHQKTLSKNQDLITKNQTKINLFERTTNLNEKIILKNKHDDLYEEDLTDQNLSNKENENN